METYTFLINTLFLRKVKYQSKFFQNNLSKVKGFKPIKFNPNLQVFTIKTPFLKKEVNDVYFDFQDYFGKIWIDILLFLKIKY